MPRRKDKKLTEPEYYVYTLAYPPTMEGGRVFYVGKGKKDRIDQHEILARAGKPGPRYVVIRSIWAAGEQVVKTKVFLTNNEEAAYNEEGCLIKQYGFEGLVNHNTQRGRLSQTEPIMEATSLVMTASMKQAVETVRLQRKTSLGETLRYLIQLGLDSDRVASKRAAQQ